MCFQKYTFIHIFLLTLQILFSNQNVISKETNTTCNNLKQNTHSELGKWLYKHLSINATYILLT